MAEDGNREMNEQCGQAGSGVGNGEEHDGQVLDNAVSRQAEALNSLGLVNAVFLYTCTQERGPCSRAVLSALNAVLVEKLAQSLEADERNIVSRRDDLLV